MDDDNGKSIGMVMVRKKGCCGGKDGSPQNNIRCSDVVVMFLSVGVCVVKDGVLLLLVL
jgi:hypothetical protein